jgi:hypothetical protein
MIPKRCGPRGIYGSSFRDLVLNMRSYPNLSSAFFRAGVTVAGQIKSAHAALKAGNYDKVHDFLAAVRNGDIVLRGIPLTAGLHQKLRELGIPPSPLMAKSPKVIGSIVTVQLLVY